MPVGLDVRGEAPFANALVREHRGEDHDAERANLRKYILGRTPERGQGERRERGDHGCPPSQRHPVPPLSRLGTGILRLFGQAGYVG
jgi:hypothetical protein